MRSTIYRMTRRAHRIRHAGEQGSISLLIVGLFVVIVVLVLGGIDVTAAHLARVRLYDTADAIALNAADSLDTRAFYRSGVGETVIVSSETVRAAAEADLASRERPGSVSGWRVASRSGSPDGQTAVVVLEGTVDLPFTSWILSALGSGVTITVEARARSELQ